MRGKPKAAAEWTFTCAVHNLFKAITAGHLTPQALASARQPRAAPGTPGPTAARLQALPQPSRPRAAPRRSIQQQPAWHGQSEPLPGLWLA